MDSRYASVRERFRGHSNQGQVVIHRGPSVSAARSFADQHFDWIHLDGDHRYESVARELDAWLPKIHVGVLDR
jgi:hypothetical protein